MVTKCPNIQPIHCDLTTLKCSLRNVRCNPRHTSLEVAVVPTAVGLIVLSKPAREDYAVNIAVHFSHSANAYRM